MLNTLPASAPILHSLHACLHAVRYWRDTDIGKRHKSLVACLSNNYDTQLFPPSTLYSLRCGHSFLHGTALFISLLSSPSARSDVRCFGGVFGTQRAREFSLFQGTVHFYFYFLYPQLCPVVVDDRLHESCSAQHHRSSRPGFDHQEDSLAHMDHMGVTLGL